MLLLKRRNLHKEEANKIMEKLEKFNIITRGPTKSDFRYRYIATKIPYRPGIPSTILYYRSRKYARINIDAYAAELSFLKTPDTPRPESTGADISRVTMPDNAWD